MGSIYSWLYIHKQIKETVEIALISGVGANVIWFLGVLIYNTARVPWFLDSESTRKVFKIALLEQALVPIPPPGIGDFRKRYWSISQRDEYRDLRMPEHGGNFHFHPEGLPARVRLVHKVVRGRVEIVLKGKRNEFLALKRAVAEIPGHSFEVRAYPKSSAVSAQVSQLIREMNFDPQKEKVVEGLQEAVKLWEWFRGNKDAVMGAVS